MEERIKDFARKYLGIELRRANVMNSTPVLLKSILETQKTDLILDVGGFTGHYGQEIRSGGFTGEFISFEPIKNNFEQLKSKADKDANWHYHNVGLGTKSEELTINIAGNYASSSLLGMHQNHVDFAPNTAYKSQEKIQIKRLDEVITKAEIEKYRSVYMKIDVQGFELNVLEGAAAILPFIKVIQAEISFIPLYENAPLYDEVIKKIKDLGFELFTILPELKDHRNGRLLQGEGIFIRK